MVVALAASAFLTLPATPALADDPTVSITGLSNATLAPGQSATLNFSIKNNNDGLLGTTSFDVDVTTTFGELSCSGRCDFTESFAAEETKQFEVKLVAGNVGAGQTKSGEVRISARAGGDQGGADREVRIRGAAPPPPEPQVQTVSEVSGRVTDQRTGDPVSGANVRLRDSQGHQYSTNSNSNGGYKFTGSRDRPISPGSLQLTVSKGDINNDRTVNGNAGQRLTNTTLRLPLAVEPTASAEPTTEVTDDPALEEDTEEEPTEAAPAADNAAGEEDSGGGMGSMLLILAGGILVALGVGAIVLLVMRRKENDEDEDEDASTGPRPGGPAGAGGAYRGGDQTRVGTRAGAGADPTMVTRSSLADAPTMMHNGPLVEEFPDPYGAPLPAQQPAGAQGWAGDGYGNAPGSGAGGYGNAPGSGAGGYGGAPAGYGNAPGSGAGGYGAAPGSGAGYGAPTSGAGYPPAPGGGYGERYDEPTGRYDPRGEEDYRPPADPYDSGSYGPSSGAGRPGYEEPGQPPYGQGAGYEQPGGGYAAGRGYDGPSAGAGYDAGGDNYGGAGDGYGANGNGYAQQGYEPERGYDQPSTGAGYDQPSAGGGYGQPGGYDGQAGYDRGADPRAEGYDGRGYDQQGGGYYDDPAQGGRGRAGAQQQPSRSERRSLDWLDD